MILVGQYVSTFTPRLAIACAVVDLEIEPDTGSAFAAATPVRPM
jgi:hypothetical protein